MRNPDLIEKAFYDSIDEINELLPVEKKIIKSPDTIIVGQSSSLDSLLLLNLIILIEEKLKQSRITTESLVDHIMIIKERNVSVQMLADFISNSQEFRA